MTELPSWDTLTGWMSARTEATADLKTEGHDAIRLGQGDGAAAAVVTGSPQRVAGWLTGRSPGNGLTVTAGQLPDLPRWL